MVSIRDRCRQRAGIGQLSSSTGTRPTPFVIVPNGATNTLLIERVDKAQIVAISNMFLALCDCR